MKQKIDDKEYEEDLEMATVMNEHFLSVFTRESDMREENDATENTIPLENVDDNVLQINKVFERTA